MADAVLRPAQVDDEDAIATLWYESWSDGHRGNVPDELLPHRHREHFFKLVPSRVRHTTVAEVDGAVVGFVVVDDAEIEQLYVDSAARGSGIAARLIAHGETEIGVRHEVAWLAVVEGNARARRFYEKCGWSDAGPLDYRAEIEGGRISVPTRRYEKHLLRQP